MMVSYHLDERVAEINLDDPSRHNALGFGTIEAIRRGVRRAEQEGAHVILLTSTGRTFSAGADFNDLVGTADDLAFDEALAQLTQALRRSHLPVLAAVQGPCLGAAVDLVISTDVVVAGHSARFEVPAARLGLLYNPQSIAVMRERIPSGALRQLMLGLSIGAASALSQGIVAMVTDDSMVVAEARRAAGDIAQGHRDAISATKQLLGALEIGPVRFEHWQSIRMRLMDSEHRFAAIAARRTPATSSPAAPRRCTS